MLERVALHQTRLRVPGVGLDARGVALGARGLVLLPSIDRLVAFLGIYSEQQSLAPLASSLRALVVCSALGAREVALSLDAGGSDRMDKVAEVARLAGGFCFTGTTRHFVQYRDASAPFGWDAAEVSSTDAALALYHASFSQTYEIEREIDLPRLLLRLGLRPDPKTLAAAGPYWLLAEVGLGPVLASYFVRSGIAARAGVVEWPPESSFDETPVRRWLFDLPDPPARVRPLLRSTPGLTVYLPAGPGVAVEIGHRHPIALRSCPVFDERSLSLLRGHSLPPLLIERVPTLGDVTALVHTELAPEPAGVGRAVQPAKPERAVLRLAAHGGAPISVAATLIAPEDLPLLRRLAYALPREVIATTRIAVTSLGALCVRDDGIEGLPLGAFHRRVHPQVYVPLGLEVVPRVAPEVLFAALGAPADRVLLLRPEGGVLGVEGRAFVPLEQALVQPEVWTPLVGATFEALSAIATPVLMLEPLGFLPLRGVEPAP